MAKRTNLMIGLAALMVFATNFSCATRQVVDEFAGATGQRLTTHSIDDLMKKLPEVDFSLLADRNVSVICHFIEKGAMLDYARERLEMELIERFGCTIADDPSAADRTVHLFFTSMGTDADKAGFKTPELLIPGYSAVSIDLLTLDMYHGISEGYYYILDGDRRLLAKGGMIKSVIRKDEIGLPIINIPVTDLE